MENTHSNRVRKMTYLQGECTTIHTRGLGSWGHSVGRVLVLTNPPARCPDMAARLHVYVSDGHCCSRAHFSTSTQDLP